MRLINGKHVIAGTRELARLISISISKATTTNQMAFNNETVKHFSWTPQNTTTFLNGENSLKYVCIVLNRKIRVPTDIAQNIWQNAQLRCLVDGGANRWKQFLETRCQNISMKQPDLITGDFDSVTEETLACFQTTKRVHTPDQSATDFTKSIGVLKPFLEKAMVHDIIVFHDTSGRFDQIMANINTLFKVQSASLNVYLLSGNSITWLLCPGKHSIRIPIELVENKRWCALIPIGGTATKVTTTGLKWNLCNGRLEFGGMVSTSNTYASENVEIETENFLIWSMGLFCFDDSC